MVHCVVFPRPLRCAVADDLSVECILSQCSVLMLRALAVSHSPSPVDDHNLTVGKFAWAMAHRWPAR